MDETISNAVEDLLRTYRENGGINYIEAAATLPSRPAVDAACVELLSILFPGFHGEPLVHAGELPEATMSRIQALHARLTPEVCKSLAAVKATDSVEADAEEILRFFFSQLARLREMLWADIDAAYEGDPAAISYEEIILAYPTIEAIAIQRMAHLLYQKDLPLIPRMMTEWAHGRTGIDIHPGAQIGSHFFIDHGTGVVIGETCVIGSHVKLYHGVTLGARSFQKDDQGQIRKGGKRHPNVEDRVTIYPNSTVLGARRWSARAARSAGTCS
jgi:serine O-acetyltransferase